MNLDFCWAVLTLLYSSAQPSLAQFSRRATLAFFFHTKHCWHTKSFWSNPLLLYFSWQIALHASPPSHFMLFGARNPYVFYIVSSTALASTAVFRYKVWEFLWFCFTTADRWQFMFVSWEVLLSISSPLFKKSQIIGLNHNNV